MRLSWFCEHSRSKSTCQSFSFRCRLIRHRGILCTYAFADKLPPTRFATFVGVVQAVLLKFKHELVLPGIAGNVENLRRLLSRNAAGPVPSLTQLNNVYSIPVKANKTTFQIGWWRRNCFCLFLPALQLIKSNLFDNGIAYHLLFLFISIGYRYISWQLRHKRGCLCKRIRGDLSCKQTLKPLSTWIGPSPMNSSRSISTSCIHVCTTTGV